MLERLLADSDGNRDEWPDEQSHASQDYQRRHRSPSRQCTDLRPSLARVLGACLAVVVLLGLLFHLWDAAVPQRASMQPSIASRFAEAARSRQDRRLPMQPPLSDPSPGLFSITEGLHVLNSITTLNLTVVGSAKVALDIMPLPDLPTSPATPPIHLPPSISFSYLVESTQEHLDPSAPLIISSSVSGSTAVIHVTSPVGSIIDQLAIGSSLGIPLSKTPLTLNLNIDNGAVRFAAFNASFAFGSVAVHVDTGLIDTNGLAAQSVWLTARAGTIRAVANVTHSLHAQTDSGWATVDVLFEQTPSRRRGRNDNDSPSAGSAHVSAANGYVSGSVIGYSELSVSGGTGPITMSLAPVQGGTTTTSSDAGITRLSMMPGYHGTLLAETRFGRVSVTGRNVHLDPPSGLPPSERRTGRVGDAINATSTIHASVDVGVISLNFA